MQIYCDEEKKSKIESTILPPYVRSFDDQKLKELYTLLKPIITVDEMKYLLKECTLEQLRDKQYYWADVANKENTIYPENMEIIADFLCLHTNKDYASLAEIISQVPDQVIDYANAFEVVEGPDLREGLLTHAVGLHLSKVRTYKIKK